MAGRPSEPRGLDYRHSPVTARRPAAVVLLPGVRGVSARTRPRRPGLWLCQSLRQRRPDGRRPRGSRERSGRLGQLLFHARHSRGGRATPARDRRSGRRALRGDQLRILDPPIRRAPDVVGKTLVVNRVPVTIVGVTPKGFHGALPLGDPRVTLPMAFRPAIESRAQWRDPSGLVGARHGTAAAWSVSGRRCRLSSTRR